MRIAATEALPVTLLPTVHVSAVNGLCGGATDTRGRNGAKRVIGQSEQRASS